ncbi:MAG: hypothetical protein LUD27_00590 [Clostridia bacterium]|nr:hypothetical protein [Clostridia bacterium]
MGGRGSSSGISVRGKVYGTEYTALHTSGSIKFVKYNDARSAKTPMETMTKGRIYATVNEQNQVKAITLYDDKRKRYKQIDVIGETHRIDGKWVLPHSHYGYYHSENGTEPPNEEDKKLIDKVLKIWDNFNRKH